MATSSSDESSKEVDKSTLGALAASSPEETNKEVDRPALDRLQTQTAAKAVDMGLIAKLKSKLGDELVSFITKALLAGVGASALFLWHPLWRTVRQFISERKNVTSQAAADIARSHVGRDVMWTTPFRNLDDPLQYIVTWDTMYSKHCSAQGSQDQCDRGQGAYTAHLLSGSGAFFTDTDLHLPTGAAWEPINADDNDYKAKLTGVTDWNRDGKKEILTTAQQQARTDSYAETYLTLFDTGNGHTNQLRVITSSTEQSQTLIGPDSTDPLLRKWLIERFEEYPHLNDGGENCVRKEDGELTCKKMEADDLDAKTQLVFQHLETLQGRWLNANGPDFFSGKISLQYEPWLLEAVNDGEKCSLEPGKYDLYNYFKGPLALNDLQNQRSTVLYQQSGYFLREIPSIIVGHDYIWLGLTVDRKILAIRRADFTIVPFSVREWALHAPKWLTKGEQQVGLTLNGANLVSPWPDRKVIHPQSDQSAISPTEFVGAHDCRDDSAKDDDSKDDDSTTQ